MPISFEPTKNKDIIDLEKDEIVVKELLIGDIWDIINTSNIDTGISFKEKIRSIFYGVLNRLITVNGEHKTPTFWEAQKLDFFMKLVNTLYPYIKGTMLPQLLALLNTASPSAK